MTGRTIQAIDPLISAQQRAAGLNSPPGHVQRLPAVADRPHLPDAARHAARRWPTSARRSTRCSEQRAFLQQVVHQTTHSLARFFLEVDANYKQFKTASRLRAAAAQRLEAQRAFYEEGRITIDRYLDAVSQYASAVAQEAQFKTTLQHLDRRPGGGQGDAAGLRQHRRGRRPAPAEGVHPGPRPAGRAPAAPDPARRPLPPDADQRPGGARPGRRRSRRPRPAPDRATAPPLPAPVGPLGPPPTPVPPDGPGRRARTS